MRWIILSLAAALAASVSTAGFADQRTMTCPKATVLCLERVGYNYQICGSLQGEADRAQEFPTCFDSGRVACAPCWFGADGTIDRCRQAYGPRCGYFTLERNSWDEPAEGLAYRMLLGPLLNSWRASVVGDD